MSVGRPHRVVWWPGPRQKEGTLVQCLAWKEKLKGMDEVSEAWIERGEPVVRWRWERSADDAVVSRSVMGKDYPA